MKGRKFLPLIQIDYFDKFDLKQLLHYINGQPSLSFLLRRFFDVILSFYFRFMFLFQPLKVLLEVHPADRAFLIDFEPIFCTIPMEYMLAGKFFYNFTCFKIDLPFTKLSKHTVQVWFDLTIFMFVNIFLYFSGSPLVLFWNFCLSSSRERVWIRKLVQLSLKASFIHIKMKNQNY